MNDESLASSVLGESRAQPREPVPCEEEELQGDQPESPTLDASFRLSAACCVRGWRVLRRFCGSVYGADSVFRRVPGSFLLRRVKLWYLVRVR